MFLATTDIFYSYSNVRAVSIFNDVSLVATA